LALSFNFIHWGSKTFFTLKLHYLGKWWESNRQRRC
jgi:hypothetical protein